jgi:ribosomal-protein-serine acetyltransferase
MGLFINTFSLFVLNSETCLLSRCDWLAAEQAQNILYSALKTPDYTMKVIFLPEAEQGGILADQFITIDTDLTLALLGQEHSGEVFQLVQSNREHLKEWLPWADQVNGTDDSTGFIAGVIHQYESGSGPNYAIMFRGAVAGIIGFHPIDWPNRNAEIGYWLGRNFTGRGLVTRSAQRMLDFGFRELNLNRIEIRCAALNIRSRSVAERLGMVLEGILREEEWLIDHFVDHAVYSILQKDYK